jgi:hypothetical protein
MRWASCGFENPDGMNFCGSVPHRSRPAAPPGSVLTTGETLRLAAGLVQVKPPGPVAIQGLADYLPMHDLLKSYF